MKRAKRLAGPFGVAMVCFLAARPAALQSDRLTHVMTREAFAGIPLFFIENRGQVDAPVSYYTHGFHTGVSFTSREVTFDLVDVPSRTQSEERIGKMTTSLAEQEKTGRHHTVTLEFVGANPDVQPVGRQLTPTVVNYFGGPRDQWQMGLKTYSELLYPDLWPGIDLVYSGTTEGLKYTFRVKPGADPRDIRLAYRGVTEMRVNDAGELEVTTPVRVLRDKRPYSYHETNGKREEVTTAYSLGGTGEWEYGFDVGVYDPHQTLLIDPTFLFYAAYFGTAGEDRGLGIAVDSEGNAYITGQVPNGLSRGVDAYVAKVDATGTGLFYLTFIGGTGFDASFDVAVDASENAHITGATNSSEASFPVLGGPDLTHNGGVDAFIAKLDRTGNLIFAGYIGGAGTDFAEGIVVDGLGNIYVTGPTESDETTFPAIVGPDVTHNGGFDVFVAKVEASPTDPVVQNNFVYCGYIGGSQDDIGTGPPGRFLTAGHIAVDANGSAYVSGMTRSTEATFPVAVGPDLTHNGGYDAFVVKVAIDGTGLIYAGYIGGDEDDLGFGMAVDPAGNAYLTGRTSSSEATFPVTVGPDLTYGGGIDAFVAKVATDGASLIYAGYIGGDALDQGTGLTIDGAGNVYVVGHTHSNEATFPVRVGPDLTFNGGHPGLGDAFVAKLRAVPSDPVEANNFEYCGYFGGAGEDTAFWVGVDQFMDAYIIGDTESAEATFPDGDGFGSVKGGDLTFNGRTDAFLAKIVNMPFSGPLHSGDILATYFGADLPLALRVNPLTGEQAVVFFPGGVDSERPGLAIDSNQRLLVARSDFRVASALERVDLISDPPKLTVLSEAGFFKTVCDVALEPDGSILVADADSPGTSSFSGAIIRVDQTTGAQTIVSTGRSFLNPVSLTLEPKGTILVADNIAAALIRVNPMSGSQKVVASGGFLQFPGPEAIVSTRDTVYAAVAVADDSGRISRALVVRVDPKTGSQELVTADGFLRFPDDIALEASGNLLVLDPTAKGSPGTPLGAIVRIHPDTGLQEIVSAGRLLLPRPGFGFCGRAITVVP